MLASRAHSRRTVLGILAMALAPMMPSLALAQHSGSTFRSQQAQGPISSRVSSVRNCGSVATNR